MKNSFLCLINFYLLISKIKIDTVWLRNHIKEQIYKMKQDLVLVFINLNFEESGGTNEEDKEVANKNININTLDRRTPSDSDLVSSNLLMQAGFHELNQVQFFK